LVKGGIPLKDDHQISMLTTFVNSWHDITNSKCDFVLKKQFLTFEDRNKYDSDLEWQIQLIRI